MKVVFLGVGEACDERKPNTSVLLRSAANGAESSILLDCGFTVPPCYWKHMRSPDELDLLWLSHFHGDHFCGVPALLLRFWEMKRRKPLRIMGQKGVEKLVHETMSLAYPGFLAKMTYSLDFAELEPGDKMEVHGIQWRSAENAHSLRDLAVRIDDGAHSVFYSGDGSPTDATLELARGCDLVAHEAFGIEPIIDGHGTIQGCIDFAREAGARQLALIHVQRDVRRKRYEEIISFMEDAEDISVFLPEPDDVLELWGEVSL